MSSQPFAIVPAAGHSRRMGRPKLLLPVAGSTVIETVIAAWQQGGVEQVVIVCRGDDQALIDLCRSAQALVVCPDAPPPNMKDSVSSALREIEARFQPGSDAAWLLAPADLPHLAASVIRKLVAEHDPRHPRILVPSHAGRRGHPVLFPWSLAEEVHRLGDDQGVNVLLQRHPVTEIDAGAEGLPRDLDTPEDYEQLG
jgi:molybdenum cofactor cytidylyltransferase